MWLLLAEAGLALGLLIFIVWWTMSGRAKHGQPSLTQEVKVGDEPPLTAQLPKPPQDPKG